MNLKHLNIGIQLYIHHTALTRSSQSYLKFDSFGYVFLILLLASAFNSLSVVRSRYRNVGFDLVGCSVKVHCMSIFKNKGYLQDMIQSQKSEIPIAKLRVQPQQIIT